MTILHLTRMFVSPSESVHTTRERHTDASWKEVHYRQAVALHYLWIKAMKRNVQSAASSPFWIPLALAVGLFLGAWCASANAASPPTPPEPTGCYYESSVPAEQSLIVLKKAYGEKPAFWAITSVGTMLVITVNPATGTWTMGHVHADFPDRLYGLMTGTDWDEAHPGWMLRR